MQVQIRMIYDFMFGEFKEKCLKEGELYFVEKLDNGDLIKENEGTYYPISKWYYDIINDREEITELLNRMRTLEEKVEEMEDELHGFEKC